MLAGSGGKDNGTQVRDPCRLTGREINSNAGTEREHRTSMKNSLGSKPPRVTVQKKDKKGQSM